MIVHVVLALQLVTASAPSSPARLVVRNATRSATVTLLQTAAGPMLPVEALRPILSVDIARGAAGAYIATIGGVRFKLETGSPIVVVGDDARQLVSPPAVHQGQLLVPLQFASELVPALVPNTHWDAEEGALVLFSMIEHKADRRASAPASTRDAPRALRRAREIAARPVKLRGRRTVIVDAGHGGPDNGMTGPMGSPTRIYEKDVTLAVAKRLGETLKRRGVDVVYTRTTDTLIALSDRGQVFNPATITEKRSE